MKNLILLTILACFATVISPPLPAEAAIKSVKLQWQERALLAKERIKALTAKPITTLEQKYNYALEKAFAAHGDPSTALKLRSVKGGVESYTLSLNCSEGNEGCFEIAYNYAPKSGKLISYDIKKFPKDWVIMSYMNTCKLLAVTDSSGNCFAIDVANPFNSYVAMTE